MGDHTEVIQIDFDPQTITYSQMLAHFWSAHSPWHPMRGMQYRNVLLVENESQKQTAEASKAALEAKENRLVQTRIETLGHFTRAENYHQKYALRRHTEMAREYLDALGDGDSFTDSTATMRLNAYLAGYGDLEQIAKDTPHLGLSQKNERAFRSQTSRRFATARP